MPRCAHSSAWAVLTDDSNTVRHLVHWRSANANRLRSAFDLSRRNGQHVRPHLRYSSISRFDWAHSGIAWSRYVFSVSLLIVGFSNLILGMCVPRALLPSRAPLDRPHRLYGAEIRSWRGQIAPWGGGGESKKDKLMNAFEVRRLAFVCTVQYDTAHRSSTRYSLP